MRLLRLTITNFMPYKGANIVEFPTGPANVVVIYGDNMRGKTSFLNAIRFAFFGHATARQVRNINPIDLFNIEAAEAGEWFMSVSVEFEHLGSNYEVRRELRPLNHVARPVSSSELKATFFVRKDGVSLSGKDLLFEMNQVLPEGISRFFLFDGELLQEYEMLVRDPANASKIQDAVEAILGVPALTKGLSEIQSLRKQAQGAQAEDLRHSRTLQGQAEQQIALQSQIAKFRDAYDARVNDKAQLDERAADLQSKLEQFSLALELERQLVETNTALAKANGVSGQLKMRRADLLQDAWIDLLQPRLQILRRDLEEDRDGFIKALAERAGLVKRAEELKRGLENLVCPLCGDRLNETHIDHLSADLGALEGKLSFLSDDINSFGLVQGRLDAISRLRSSGLASRVVNIEKEMRTASVEIAELERRASSLEEQLKEFSGREAERLRAEREQIRSLAASAQREIDERIVELTKAQRKLDQVSRLMSKNPAARRQKSSRLVSLYSALDEVFADGVGKLRDRQRLRVQDYASAAFRHLTSEPDYEALEINAHYGLTILDNKGRPVGERSAGAEQIVALSLIDGLNRAGRRGGPIVMDTPFGRLDWVHRTNVLRYLPEMAEQVILLVHEGEMDPERDLPTLGDKVGAMYRITRVSARHSTIVREPAGAVR